MSDIRDKIKKLLALAEGQANENESAAAMEMASRLMMQHGIEQEELKDKPKPKTVPGDVFDVADKYCEFLAHAAAKLNGTAVWVRGSGIYFVGRRDNIDVSQDMLAWLILQVEAFYKEALPRGLSKKDRADFRRSFKRSCALRVAQRAQDVLNYEIASQDAKKNQDVSDAAKRSLSSSTAIAIVGHRQELQEELKQYHQDAGGKTIKARAVTIGGSGYVAGRSAGDRVQLRTSIS